MSEYDSPWKEALDVYFEPFMAFFFPEAHAAIDWSKGYETLDKELQRIVKGKLGRRFVDKLVRVWLKAGGTQCILIHIEVQMTKRAKFGRRMFVYFYRLFDKYYNEEVISLAVLGDAKPDWRPDSFGYKRWGFEIAFKFPIVKLLDYADRLDVLERHENPFALIVLAHLRTLQTRDDPKTRSAAKIKLIKSLYGRGMNADGVRQLFRVIDWIMDLPKPMDDIFWQEIEVFEKEKFMPFITTPERLGREKGLAQGRIEGIVTSIEVILKDRFPDLADSLISEIREIDNPDKLKAILFSALKVSTADELRAML